MRPRLLLRRSVLPLALAVCLAPATSIAANGLAPATTSAPPPVAAASSPAPTATPFVASDYSLRRPVPATRPVAAIDPAVAQELPNPKPAAKPKSPAPRPPSHASAKAAPVYSGRNHVWIPALGINRSVGWYACGTPTAPGLGVYRWGCAGANNVYLLAHAYAAFRSLHDAYVSGRLYKGMRVMYADGSGRVRTYSVIWWRLTTPDNGAFAYAAQSRPSMTLQTCVGSRSQYRLIVRLVQIS